MTARGMSPLPILDVSEPGAVEGPDLRVPLSQYVELWTAACRDRPDPMLGIRIAQATRLEAFDALGYYIKVAPTLGEALQRLSRHCGVLSDAMTCLVDVRDGRLTVELESLVGINCPTASADFALASAAGAIARLVGVPARPSEVRLAYPKPAHANALCEHFGAPVVFGANAHGLVFDAALWDQPCVDSDPVLGRVLARQVRSWASATGPGESLLNQVQNAIETRLPDGAIGAKDVASDLAMSERTLRRRLSEAGASYQGVLDEVRFRLARRYLRTTSMDIGEIAHQLGFSDASGFTRAFRRWAGGTAMEFRRRTG